MDGCPYEDCRTLFHVWQEDVLLGAVEVMEFIHEEDGPLLEAETPLLGLGEDTPDVFGAGGGGINLLKMGLSSTSDDVGQGGLPSTWWPVKEDGGESIGLEHPPEELTRTKEMALPNKLLYRPGTHPEGQGGVWVYLVFGGVRESK